MKPVVPFRNCLRTRPKLRVYLTENTICVPVNVDWGSDRCMLYEPYDAHSTMRGKTQRFLVLQQMVHIITGLGKVNPLNFGLRVFFNSPN